MGGATDGTLVPYGCCTGSQFFPVRVREQVLEPGGNAGISPVHFEPSKVVALYIEVVYVALWKIKPRDPSADGGEHT